MDFLTLKRHNCFQNYNDRKATHAFLLPDLPDIFKLQQELLKISKISVSETLQKVF